MNSKQEDLKRSIQEENKKIRRFFFDVLLVMRGEQLCQLFTQRRGFIEPCNRRSVGYARWIALAVIHSKNEIRRAV